MSVQCPRCQSPISLQDVNVSTDIALCRNCATNHAYSELLAESSIGEIDLAQPPKGTWFRRKANGFVAGASTRSALAIFLVPFMCIWSGGSLGGIYGSQIMEGKFDPFRSLFGIPFVLGTLLFGSLAAMSAAGKVEIKVIGNSGELFLGVWRLGWTRRFKWHEVTAVRVQDKLHRRGMNTEEIVLEGPKRLSFGSGLKHERLRFLTSVLKQMRKELP